MTNQSCDPSNVRRRPLFRLYTSVLCQRLLLSLFRVMLVQHLELQQSPIQLNFGLQQLKLLLQLSFLFFFSKLRFKHLGIQFGNSHQGYQSQKMKKQCDSTLPSCHSQEPGPWILWTAAKTDCSVTHVGLIAWFVTVFRLIFCEDLHFPATCNCIKNYKF